MVTDEVRNISQGGWDVQPHVWLPHVLQAMLQAVNVSEELLV